MGRRLTQIFVDCQDGARVRGKELKHMALISLTAANSYGILWSIVNVKEGDLKWLKKFL